MNVMNMNLKVDVEKQFYRSWLYIAGRPIRTRGIISKGSKRMSRRWR